MLYGLVVLSHARREIVHINVTAHPTGEWTKQQLLDLFPWNSWPAYLHRDNDKIYGNWLAALVDGAGAQDKPSAARSPWQNPYAERVIGSIRRELLDHVIVLNEDHARRLLRSYQRYYNNSRTHLSLRKDAPHRRPTQSGDDPAVAIPEVFELHYRYERRAA